MSVVGDGVQMALRLALQLAAPPNSLVLLEEPEIHQHPGAIRQSAAVIAAAVRNGVQVVVSTHSLELVDALLAEAHDDEEIDRICMFRLRLDDGHLQAERVAGAEIAFARAQIGDDLR